MFLDRDGTLNVERGYLADPADAVLLPGVRAAVLRFRDAGYLPVVITNQSGIARGLLTPEDLARIHWKLQTELDHAVAGWLHCPHHPDVGEAYRRRCACRKPAAGLLHRGRRLFDLDLARSWTIGDSARDVVAGHSAGTSTMLVRSGKPVAGQIEALAAAGVTPDAVVDDLPAAADLLLGAG